MNCITDNIIRHQDNVTELSEGSQANIKQQEKSATVSDTDTNSLAASNISECMLVYLGLKF